MGALIPRCRASRYNEAVFDQVTNKTSTSPIKKAKHVPIDTDHGKHCATVKQDAHSEHTYICKSKSIYHRIWDQTEAYLKDRLYAHGELIVHSSGSITMVSDSNSNYSGGQPICT